MLCCEFSFGVSILPLCVSSFLSNSLFFSVLVLRDFFKKKTNKQQQQNNITHSYDATAFELKQSIEGAFEYAGKVEVSRQGPDAQKAFIWTVTFTSAADIVPQLESKSYLTGSGATVTVETLTEGNTIGGTFTLAFLGSMTRPISHDVMENDLRYILEHDLPVETAHVVRNDPRHECRKKKKKG